MSPICSAVCANVLGASKSIMTNLLAAILEPVRDVAGRDEGGKMVWCFFRRLTDFRVMAAFKGDIKQRDQLRCRLQEGLEAVLVGNLSRPYLGHGILHMLLTGPTVSPAAIAAALAAPLLSSPLAVDVLEQYVLWQHVNMTSAISLLESMAALPEANVRLELLLRTTTTALILFADDEDED